MVVVPRVVKGSPVGKMLPCGVCRTLDDHDCSLASPFSLLGSPVRPDFPGAAGQQRRAAAAGACLARTLGMRRVSLQGS